MKQPLLLAGVFLGFVSAAAGQGLPKPLVEDEGLKGLSAITVGAGGKIYVARQGQGDVLVIDHGKAVPFATGVGRPNGLAAFQQWLFVTDDQRVWRIDPKGKAEVFVAADAFPVPTAHLFGIVADAESGTLYVSDFLGSTVFRITPQKKVSVVLDGKNLPPRCMPYGLAIDGASHLLLTD